MFTPNRLGYFRAKIYFFINLADPKGVIAKTLIYDIVAHTVENEYGVNSSPLITLNIGSTYTKKIHVTNPFDKHVFSFLLILACYTGGSYY